MKLMIFYGLWLFICVFGAYALLGTDGYFDYRQLMSQHAGIKEDKRVLEAERADLLRRVHRLQNDWKYIEAVAREQLLMVPEHAMVYHFRETGSIEEEASFFP
ncbi:FtsB family cell division protein [Desulfobotulus mexicanus]|uniref:Septum formation initiator family protein n=1 Tax=Desulfobotulus mexicanus TaxID=2586642 RepID=A0A5S5MFH4_9BACT|nr:septum formation initiator family protein [Desulfobotulus mexicanus]TYT74429.1 septum formation initiator family protein [Desulfobotulus mexicanus]